MSPRDGTTRTGGLLTGVLFAVPLLCCAGLPLLLAVGAGAGAVLVMGGGILGGVAVAAGAVLLALRLHRRRKAACRIEARPGAPRGEAA